MSKVGTVSNLRVLDIVKTRAGGYRVVLPNSNSKNGLGTFSERSNGCERYLSEYNEDLTCDLNRMHDVMKVYKYESVDAGVAYYIVLRAILTGNIDYLCTCFENIKSDWVREEAKRMTVAEIEEQLGYKVEIVSEEK